MYLRNLFFFYNNVSWIDKFYIVHKEKKRKEKKKEK